MKQILLFVIAFNFYPAVWAFDHNYASWKKVITNYVNYQNNPVTIDYLSLKKDQRDFNKHLKAIIGLSRADYGKFTVEQKKAFILNAYSALAIRAVLDQVKDDHLPKSIKDGNSMFTDVFNKKFFKMFGEMRSLNYLEKEIEPEFQGDLKFIFCFACAARGCPPPIHYTPDTLNENQISTIRVYLKNNKGARYDVAKNVFYVSDYFEAREDSISKSGQNFKDFLIRYLPISEKFKDKAIRNESTSTIEYEKMDWSLNSL